MQTQRIISSGPQLEGLLMKGEFRLRFYEEAEFQALQALHPDWPREYLLHLCTQKDSGWIRNTITDFGRKYLAGGNQWATSMNLFMHEATAVGDVERDMLQFTYPSQTPSQVATPVNNFDRASLVQIRTQTFTAPAVARNINIVGLTVAGSVNAERAVVGIAAFTKLTTTQVQSTVQTADVQYRVTWSFS